MLTCRLRSINLKLKVVGGKLVVVNVLPHCQAFAKYSKPAREATCPRGGFGRSPRAAAVLRHFLASPPRTWFWCVRARGGV